MRPILIILALSFAVFAQSAAEKQGREIIEKNLAAIGAKENSIKIKTIEIIKESENSLGKTRSIEIEDRVNKRRYSCIDGDRGKIENGSNGVRSWMRRGGRADYTNINESKEEVKYLKLTNEIINGKEYLVVEEVSKDSRRNVKTYYDPETFLLMRRENMAGFSGQTSKIVTIYSDYRKVDGFPVPFLEISENSFLGKTTKKTLSIRYNIEVDPKIFELNGPGLEIPKNIPLAKPDSSTIQPISFNINKNVIYKDEDGKNVSHEEFREIQLGANYLTETEISNGEVVGLKLKKGNSETAIGATPPDFTAVTLDDSLIKLSELKGKVVVINFWFLACSPCIKEMPDLNDLVKKYQHQEVEFIAVTFDKHDLVAKSLKNRAFDYKHIVDTQNIIDLYKATAYPTHIVLDKTGKILFTQLGYNQKMFSEMIKIIDSALI